MQGLPKPPGAGLPKNLPPLPSLPRPPANNIVPFGRLPPRPPGGILPLLSKIKPGPAGLVVAGLILALFLWQKFKDNPKPPTAPWVEWVGPKPSQPGTYLFETVTGWHNEGYNEDGYYSESYTAGTLLSLEKQTSNTGLRNLEQVVLHHYLNGVSVFEKRLPNPGGSLGDQTVTSFQIKATLISPDGGGPVQPELPDGANQGKPEKRLKPTPPYPLAAPPKEFGPDGIPGTPDDLPPGTASPDAIPDPLKTPKPPLNPNPIADPKTPANPNPTPLPGVDPQTPGKPDTTTPPGQQPDGVGQGKPQPLPPGYPQPKPLPKPTPNPPDWWQYIVPAMPIGTGTTGLRPPTPPIPGPNPPTVTPRPTVDPLNPPVKEPEPLSPACQVFADYDYCKGLGPDHGGTDPVTCKFTPVDLSPLSAQIAGVDAKVTGVAATTTAHAGGWAAWTAGPWAAFTESFGAFNTFVRTAFQFTRLDKVLNALNTLLLIHNASMLSRNLAETFGEVASTALNLFGVKDEEGNGIDVGEVLGDSITNTVKNVLGEQLYGQITRTWAKASSIWSSAANIAWTIRSINDSSQEVMEWIGENTGKIGNALKKARVVGEDAYNWLPEKITTEGVIRRKYRRMADNLDNIEEAADSLQSVLSEVTDITEEVNELREEKDKFKDNLEDLPSLIRPDNAPVKAARTEQIEDSQGASPQPIDEERNIPDD
jgi:hypothetical protein